MVNAVLFDLDGTLVDTAPDLGYALNQQRQMHGLPEMPLELIRASVQGLPENPISGTRPFNALRIDVTASNT